MCCNSNNAAAANCHEWKRETVVAAVQLEAGWGLRHEHCRLGWIALCVFERNDVGNLIGQFENERRSNFAARARWNVVHHNWQVG